MGGCNASITLLLEGEDCESAVLKRVSCDLPGDHHHSDPAAIPKHGSREDAVDWWDDAPGASPHRDPEPTYVARHKQWAGEWQVIGTDHGLAAAYPEDGHPDPEGAAKAEAARLNGERWRDRDDVAHLTYPHSPTGIRTVAFCGYIGPIRPRDEVDKLPRCPMCADVWERRRGR